jgi:hypothetical protein
VRYGEFAADQDENGFALRQAASHSAEALAEAATARPTPDTALHLRHASEPVTGLTVATSSISLLMSLKMWFEPRVFRPRIMLRGADAIHLASAVA